MWLITMYNFPESLWTIGCMTIAISYEIRFESHWSLPFSKFSRFCTRKIDFCGMHSSYSSSIWLGYYFWGVFFLFFFHFVLFANALKMCEINNFHSSIPFLCTISYGCCGNNLFYYLFINSWFRLNKSQWNQHLIEMIEYCLRQQFQT